GRHTLEASVYGNPGGTGPVIAQASVTFELVAPRVNLVYDTKLPADDILLDGAAGIPALRANRGGLRQSARTSVSPWGVSRLNGTALSKLSAREIADTLRRAVDRSCGAVPRRRPPEHCAGSGLVAVDEITTGYADWDAATRAEEG